MRSALRLRRPVDFARVKRCGVVTRHPAMSISVCANGLVRNRYGIVTGKHVGIAVIRNRVKRRLRAAITELHPLLRQGFDVVLIARRGLSAQPFGELRRILSGLCTRARLIETC